MLGGLVERSGLALVFQSEALATDHDEQINAISSGSRANPRSHVVS